MKVLGRIFRAAMIVLTGLTMSTSAHAQPMIFTMEHFPPFNMDENGMATGPLPDIVRAVCAAIGIECIFETYPWRRAYVLAERGFVDGIFVLLKLPEREKDFYFTDPVIQTSFGVFARSASKFRYSSPKDLDGRTIGVYGPSATSNAAAQAMAPSSRGALSLEVDNLTVFRKLSGGRYGDHGVVIMNVDVGRYLLKQHNISDIEFVGEIQSIEYSIGLSKRKLNQTQADRFNNALRELIRSGTVKKVVEKYGMTAPLQR